LTKETIVATFTKADDAERARRALEEAGIPSGDIDVRHGGQSGYAAPTASREPDRQPGFFEWLFGGEGYHDATEDDRSYYRSHLNERNGAILTAYADDSDYSRIEAILIRWNAEDAHETPTTDTGTTAGSGLGATSTTTGAETRAEPGASTASTAAARTAGLDQAAESGDRKPGRSGETVIPTAREELRVGTRQVESDRAYNIRRYSVERPVEQNVTLREETVTVERRAPGEGRTQTPGGQPFQDKTVEVRTMREEPVVEKVVKPGEDVVVRRDVRDRTETVKDTVRESKVDVEGAGAENPSVGPRKPS